MDWSEFRSIGQHGGGSFDVSGTGTGAAPGDGVPQEWRHNPFTRWPQRGGKALSTLQLPFFLLHPPAGFGVLTTTGRRTGKPRRKCVRVIVDNSVAYLVMLGPVLLGVPKDQAVAHWLRNIRANPVVGLRVSAGMFTGTARELSEPAELATARRAYTHTVNAFDSWEYRFHTADRPTHDKIQRLHQHWFDTGVPVAIDLGDSGSR
jgi:deazaflavin-dependent oxidoreductase (nitroreductase family)